MMNELTLKDLLAKMNDYSKEDIEKVVKAYKFADKYHEGQYRQSGEPYIIHPLNVCYTLLEMHADSDTLCAGLLHDVLEDTDATYEEIAFEFNPSVAKLVDGVTKISKLNFSSKIEMKYANTRKIINGLTNDVRIIIIKLADRLHNMRTLEFKKKEKQQEIALETMEIFAPLAYSIGAYRIKCDLEDLSLMYLKNYEYNSILERRNKIEETNKSNLLDMLNTINTILNDKNIPNEIKIKTKNIYGIYRKICVGENINDIHDLMALRVIVDEIDNCYQTLGVIHSKYKPFNEMFKDYIYNPKSNLYRSLHTTVFGYDDRLVQARIRTKDMDQVASYGLTAYWYLNKDSARDKMQEDLKSKWQDFDSLLEINSAFRDNEEFVSQVKKEVFSDKVYVYTPKGETIKLPKGSTVIDFAYKIHTDIGNSMVSAIVNDKDVSFDYVLQNGDIVKIITSVLQYGPRNDWEEKAHTTYAKRKIREYSKK